jgi:Ca2+-binding EF-hand superfamily protein
MGKDEEDKIPKLFNNFDINKQGELGYNEIKSFLGYVFDELEEDKTLLKGDGLIIELLDIFGKDKNDLINFNEFNKLVDFLILEKGLIL